LKSTNIGGRNQKWK